MKRLALCGSLLMGLAACDDPLRPPDQPAAVPPAAALQQQFTVRDLGTFGGDSSGANEINEQGDVAGWAELPSGNDRTFLWRPGQGKRNLGTLGGSNSKARGMNDRDQVVGISELRPGSQVTRAFLWTEARGTRALATLGGESNFANAINDRGEIVGVSEIRTGDHQAFLWRPGHGMQRLGTLGGAESFARDINNATQVAGVSLNATGNDRAFLWTAERGMEDLGTLGGPTSAADGISETGEVVGISSTGVGTDEGFIWSREHGMRSLGSLGDRAHSFGNDVNTHLRVAGGSFNDDLTIIAHLWTPENGLRRLPTPGGLRGLPEDINEFGQIVGNFETAAGQIHATLLTPIAGPLAVASPEESAALEAVPSVGGR